MSARFEIVEGSRIAPGKVISGGAMIHPHISELIQRIDAAVFDGDAFEDGALRAELIEYIDRWKRELTRNILY